MTIAESYAQVVPAVLPANRGVTVVDACVPPELRADLQKLLRGAIWAYGWKSVKDRDPFPFWHAHFAGADDLADCEDELRRNLNAKPVEALWKFLAADILKGHTVVRAYANGHTYGAEGYIHVDSQDARYFTTIYYAHANWEADWAGETVFFERPSGSKATAVLPVPGRLVLFPGNVPHVARGVSRACPELRMTVVFKTLAP